MNAGFFTNYEGESECTAASNTAAAVHKISVELLQYGIDNKKDHDKAQAVGCKPYDS